MSTLRQEWENYKEANEELGKSYLSYVEWLEVELTMARKVQPSAKMLSVKKATYKDSYGNNRKFEATEVVRISKESGFFGDPVATIYLEDGKAKDSYSYPDTIRKNVVSVLGKDPFIFHYPLDVHEKEYIMANKVLRVEQDEDKTARTIFLAGGIQVRSQSSLRKIKEALERKGVSSILHENGKLIVG